MLALVLNKVLQFPPSPPPPPPKKKKVHDDRLNNSRIVLLKPIWLLP